MERTQLDIASNQKNSLGHKKAEGELHVCPFLGMQADPETSFLFTSPGNFCHRLQPPKAVSLGYQGTVCFDSKAFMKCPIYQEKWDGTFPEGFRQRNGNSSSQPLTPRWVIFLLLASLILLAVSAYIFFGPSSGWWPIN